MKVKLLTARVSEGQPQRFGDIVEVRDPEEAARMIRGRLAVPVGPIETRETATVSPHEQRSKK